MCLGWGSSKKGVGLASTLPKIKILAGLEHLGLFGPWHISLKPEMETDDLMARRVWLDSEICHVSGHRSVGAEAGVSQSKEIDGSQVDRAVGFDGLGKAGGLWRPGSSNELHILESLEPRPHERLDAAFPGLPS